MKVSQITLKEIAMQLRVEVEYLSDSDRGYIEILREAAIEYVKDYTGLSNEDIDLHDDITIAVLVLISDMFDNRQMYVDKSNVNRVVDTILGMHCVNLL